MKRSDFLKTQITVIRHAGEGNEEQEKMTRADLVCEALDMNMQERDQLFRKFSEKSYEIRKNWKSIHESIRTAREKFNLKEASMEEFIEMFRPREVKDLDCIRWYSKEAFEMYCRAMNYEFE